MVQLWIAPDHLCKIACEEREYGNNGGSQQPLQTPVRSNCSILRSRSDSSAFSLSNSGVPRFGHGLTSSPRPVVPVVSGLFDRATETGCTRRRTACAETRSDASKRCDAAGRLAAKAA